MNSTHFLASFSRGERAFIAIVFLVAIAGSLSWGYYSSEKRQIQEIEQQAQQLHQAAGLRIAETRSFIKSIQGMHYASDEIAGADIEAFAEQVRQYSPYLHSLGMFKDVTGELREEFQNYIRREYGIKSFSIHHYSESGKSLPSPDQKRYQPVITITPNDKEHEIMLGADFSTSAEIASMLSTAIDTDEAFITRTPNGWPFHEKFLLIQPVYQGNGAPTGVEDRRFLFVGGIWISIDLATLLYQEVDVTLNGILSMSLLSAGVRAEKDISQPDDLSHAGFDVGFKELIHTQHWLLGDSDLGLTWTITPRMPLSDLLNTIKVLFSLVLILFTILLFIRNKRHVQLERFESLRALNAEREKAELTLASISDAVISLDSERRIVYMNASASRFLRLPPTDQHEHPLEFFLSVEQDENQDKPFPGFEKALSELPTDTLEEYDVTLLLPHLKDATVKLSLTSMFDESSQKQGSIVVMKDVSHERKLTAELEYKAHYDALTGTFNRFYFEKRLMSLIEDMTISDSKHALCFIDLDNFKTVNDTCGHAAGDALLCEVTAEVRKNLRQGDMLARLGGDEFGIVICNADANDALVVANKVYDFFKDYVFESDGAAFSVSASIGFVSIHKEFNDYKTILSSADSACYAAKESGRNTLVVYSGEENDVAEQEQEVMWLPKLQDALEHGNFRLLAQPIARLDTQGVSPEVTHYEFLLRMLSTTGEYISPYKFIKSAERYSLMIHIDQWVLQHAFKSAAQVLDQLDVPCTFSINLSGQFLSDPNMLDFIQEQLNASGVDASNFWFEIKETAAITHFSSAVVILKGLRTMGAKIALDDFGSGVSSFAYLQKLPIDILKIDGQFIREVATDPAAHEMVRAMNQMSKVMGFETVAEFVESEAILTELEDIGVNFAQGYQIGRPCPLNEAISAGLPGHLIHKAA